MIHVCFGLTDKDGQYSKFTGTAMLSIFENTTSEVTVHILHDNTLTPDNRDKFSYIAGRYGQIVRFYNVEKICAEEIARYKEKFFSTNKTVFTIGIMYRFEIAKVLHSSIKKVIYLDSDIVVNLDIKKLWNLNLNDKILAASGESEGTDIPAKNYLLLCLNGLVNDEDYFNSGVLVINLEKFRKEQKTLNQGIQFISSNPQYVNFDQDVLNYCFSKNTLRLPKDFNRFVVHSRRFNDYRTDERILHYISMSLGLGMTFDFSDPFNKLWFKYFKKTPWYDNDILERLSERTSQSFNQKFEKMKSIALQLTSIMSGKTRAFFIAEPNVEAMKKIFFIREDEELITYNGQESLNALSKSMLESRGKKVFFMLLGQYLQLRPKLIRCGFVEGRDFINMEIFFSNQKEDQLNSYQLLRAM